MTASKHEIVVGVDGSPESKAALRWAVAEARLRGTDILALYAWTYPAVADGLAPAPLLYADDVLQAEANEFLDAAVAEVDGAKDVCVLQAVVEGDAAEELVRASEDADLLVVGSRGLGGVGGLVRGSVSRRCAHDAACPVVIVRDGRRAPR